jgi:DNA-binding transcriptional regulator YdaS (Cro superfamily)
MQSAFVTIPNRRQVAGIVGSSDAYLWQLETGRRRASRWLAEAIERATNGAVTCWQLRPDLFTPPATANEVVPGALDGAGEVCSE